MRNLAVLLAFLAGCSGAQPCLDACEEDGEFWDACWDALTEAGVYVDCYDDPEALGEALAAAGEDADARNAVYAAWYEDGRTHACATPDDVVADCKDRTLSEYGASDADARETQLAECVDESGNAFAEAMDAKDCDGFLALLGA